MATLSRADIDAGLRDLEGWSYDGHAITKQFDCGDFPGAAAFVQRLVPGAEAADHHPDIQINYKRVRVSYSTHSEGGVTDKDFAGARLAERVAPQR